MHPSKVFISYAREDASSARRLYNDLLAIGVRPWLDSEALLPGQRWKSEISAALKSSDFAIVLLSSHQVQKRGYVQKEIREALELLDEFPENQVFVIPARLDDCTPRHARLTEIQWVDFFPSWDAGFKRVSEVLSRVPETASDVAIIDVSGTSWVAAQMPGGTWRFEFAHGGVVRYEDAAVDRYLENGKWRQAGNDLYMELNNRYVQLQGQLLSDRTAKGIGDSIGGWHFTWQALRLDEPHRWKPQR